MASLSTSTRESVWDCWAKMGAGKSTLFKILTGEYDYDEGEISVAPGRRIGLISQIPVYPAGYTVEQVLGSAFQRIHRIQREMGMLAEKMSAGDTSREVLERYDKLNHRVGTGRRI